MKRNVVVALFGVLLTAGCSSQGQGSIAAQTPATTVVTVTTKPDPAQSACKTFRASLGEVDKTDQLYNAVNEALISRDSRIVAAAKEMQDNAILSDNPVDLPNAMVEFIHACEAAGYLPPS